jgi:hypothetical protein
MTRPNSATSRIIPAVILAATTLIQQSASAFTVNITAGSRIVYLAVGNGSFTGTLNSGGTPANNATINTVTVSVPANAVGSGAAQLMATNSTQAASFWDGFAFCTPASRQVYIGGFFRMPGAAGNATLTVTTPVAGLVNAGGNTIPFSQITWISSGNGDTGAEVIPSGTFTGGTQTLASLPVNRWNESCHAFSYLNANTVAAGTYTGRATYTLSAP